jgi:hypothetical protein
MNSSAGTRVDTGGFPHSEIHGSRPVCGSPRLIAAYHVLHRLLVPRHSPSALSSLIANFLRSQMLTHPGDSAIYCALVSIHVQFSKNSGLAAKSFLAGSHLFLRGGLVGLTGLEPVTLRLSSACSNQLSYRPDRFPSPAFSPHRGTRRSTGGGAEEIRTPDL